MANPVQIYEFSTGIHVDVDPSSPGGWVSRGFTGHYMNVTLPNGEVPHEVKRAIANKYFAVVEGGKMNQPAVIGREVQDWSVVAVVSRGRDDGGRPLSVYRYFLCEGKKSLWQILAWIEEYRQHNKCLPIFNPLQNPTNGDPHKAPVDAKPPSMNFDEETTAKLEGEVPILLSPDQSYELCELQIIHSYANSKALKIGQPVAWVYNAEVLENPRSFILIHVASDQAYQSIKSILDFTPDIITPIGFDEQKIKSAIKSLISRGNTKKDAVLTILEVIDNKEITEQHWKIWFDGQGAKKAIQQSIITGTMARLLTLRSFLIPGTLPELLCWLDGNQELQNASLRFQQEFWRCLKRLINDSHLDSESSAALTRNLVQGISTLLPELKKGQIQPILFTTLLENPQSIWNRYRKKFIISIEKDLSYIADNIDGLKKIKQDQTIEELSTDPKFWLPLTKIFDWENKQYRILPEYLPFAELFSQLARTNNEYKLAAYLYQVSQGKVSTPIFHKSFGEQDSIQYLGLTIRRDIPAIERTTKSIKKTLNAVNNKIIEILQFVYYYSLGNKISRRIFFFIFVILIMYQGVNIYQNSIPPDQEISEGQLKKAVKKIDSADTPLTKIVNEIIKQINDSPNTPYAELVNLKSKEITDLVLEVICLGVSSCQIEIDSNNNFASLDAWVKELYKYQYEKYEENPSSSRPWGVLDKTTERNIVEDTIERIKEEYIILPKQRSKALEEFSTTSKSVTNLINTIAKESGKDNETIISDFKGALGLQGDDLASYQYSEFQKHELEAILKDPDLEMQLKWIEKIAEYQQSEGDGKVPSQKLGIIDIEDSDDIFRTLKEQIENSLANQ